MKKNIVVCLMAFVLFSGCTATDKTVGVVGAGHDVAKGLYSIFGELLDEDIQVTLENTSEGLDGYGELRKEFVKVRDAKKQSVDGNLKEMMGSSFHMNAGINQNNKEIE